MIINFDFHFPLLEKRKDCLVILENFCTIKYVVQYRLLLSSIEKLCFQVS